MSIFLAPVPIIHVQSMLYDLSRGHKKFAFGSDAIDFFERKFSRNCVTDNITAYIYASKTGQSYLDVSANKQLGIFVKGRLCGWNMADRRGQYPKDGNAQRPTSSTQDGPMVLFWELDNVEQLPNRKRMSDFISPNTSKQYADDFVPQGPMWVSE